MEGLPEWLASAARAARMAAYAEDIAPVDVEGESPPQGLPPGHLPDGMPARRPAAVHAAAARQSLALTLILALAWAAGVAPPAHAGEAAARPAASTDARTQALAASDAELRDAGRAVEEATRRLTEGEEPLPGERTGLAGGHSRLNDAYFERQDKLRSDVQDAQRRLDAALKRRNALRD